jgi:NAD+ kinase
MPRVERATTVTHGATKNVDEAVARLEALAAKEGIELVEWDGSPDISVVLGGDGTMLRALNRFLGTAVPVIGVNFGRVGFLTSIPGKELEAGLARVFAGEFAVQELPTLEVSFDGTGHTAANDVVVVSNTPGRIVELAYSIGGEELGTQPCDGLICATPSGSTAYNLSNGGPVLVWGLEAAVVTFVAPHSLHQRPLVVGPDVAIEVVNRTPDVEVVVLVDGHAIGRLEHGACATVRFGEGRTMLATLPEQTFFRRYAQVFGGGR